MTSRIFLALILALSLVTSAHAQEEDLSSQSMTAIVAIGESIAEAKCGRCHALGVADKSPHKDAPPFRVVAKRYKLEDLAESLAEGILTGHPDMPVVALREDEINAFLTYLGSLLPD
ncbi:MAG: cytochrome c [Filomicrobium sp.]